MKGFQDTLQTRLTGLLDKLRQQCLVWIAIVSNHSHHQSRDVPWVTRRNDLSVEFVLDDCRLMGDSESRLSDRSDWIFSPVDSSRLSQADPMWWWLITGQKTLFLYNAHRNIMFEKSRRWSFVAQLLLIWWDSVISLPLIRKKQTLKRWQIFSWKEI